MIQAQHINKRYQDQQALSNINLDIEAGEMVFLTGHSGAGKSSLLRLLMRLDVATSGSLIIDGQDLTQMPAHEIPFYRRQIGMVFQDHRLLEDRSVFANIALPLHFSGFEPADIEKRVRAALEKVGLANKANLNPLQLSTGEQQRVGIARAMVNRPKLVLADEPTGNLDPELSTQIMQLFAAFASVGVTLIIATHDIATTEQFAHRRIELKQGQIIQDQAFSPA